MKRKYLLMLILISVIVVEIIVFSVIVIKKKNEQNNIEEVSNFEDTYDKVESIDREAVKEKLRLEMQQAKIEMERYEQKLKAKREEILKKRKALFAQYDTDNNLNSNGNVDNNATGNTNTSSNNGNINLGTNAGTSTGTSTGANTGNNNNNKDDENDGIVKVSQILNGEKENLNYTSKIEDLGIPLIKKYPYDTLAHINSRNVWDMQLYNNRIYIGSGDYDKNTGPVDVYYYDIQKEEFVNEGSLQDEQINRFVVIDNQLIITGTDPKSGWDLGNYYIWEDDKWITKNTVLGGIHVFDMVKYHGKLFAGIGNDSDSSIVMSEDNGETFSYVYMYKSKDVKLEVNSDNSGYTRVYDFMVFNDKLYAFCDHKLYEYKEEENIFMKVNDNYIIYGNGASGLSWYVPLKEKLVYNGKAILVNGSLKYTDNLEDYPNYKTLKFDKSTNIYDAIVINGELHILCATPVDDGYYISVYKTTNYENWEPVLYFKYTDFIRSFEYANGTFYFGIGTKLTSTDNGTNSGRILKIKI